MSQTTGMELGAWLWHGAGVRTPWDGLRKDSDLWDASGDCLVYLYARGGSRRPASIQVPLGVLAAAECTELLDLLDETANISPISGTDDSPSSPTGSWSSGRPELYLGAPKYLDREQTFQWHLTTRNFFAWLMHKPLAGPHLGIALSNLLDRLALYRPSNTNNLEDVLQFADEMGYTYLADQPDCAVATLVFAEEQKLRDVWVNAFTHCVGMNDMITSAPDYQALGNIPKALIRKAALQMDIDLETKGHAIGTMLEEDFGAYLGLPPSARQHLDEFRSFLQAHFVGQHGYWPPPPDRFAKHLYSSMAEDFECLYDLLADYRAADNNTQRQPTTGGICVLQNLTTFNERNNLPPLEATLPLLPAVDAGAGRKLAHRSLRGLLSGKDSRAMALGRDKTAHLAATNSPKDRWQQSPLINSFLRFEVESATAMENRLSSSDGRKVRWMLVYGMLQMLRSVLASSPEITNRDEVSYPLCCSTADLPTWERLAVYSNAVKPLSISRRSELPQSSQVSIHPDGEADYETYFAATSPKLAADKTSSSALRRFSRTLSFTRPTDRLSRIGSNDSAPYFYASGNVDASDESAGVDGRQSPSSDVPSLEWGHESRSSQDNSSQSAGSSSPHHSSQPSWDLQRRLSTSSSVYSERPSQPTLPVKSIGRGDVLDKGLAFDDFICPGLY